MDDTQKDMQQMMEEMKKALEASGLPPEMVQQMVDNAMQAQQQYTDLAQSFEEEDEELIIEFIENNAVDESKMKYMPIGALLIGTHGEPYVTLRLTQDEDFSAEILAEGWGIKDRGDGLKMLESLLKGRHAVRFGETFESLKAGDLTGIDPDDVEDYESSVEGLTEALGIPMDTVKGCRTLIGWDLERVGYLARLFVNVGFISEDEAWEWMEKASKEIKKNFSSWEEYIVSVLLGRGLAMGVHIEPYAVAHDLLTTNKSFLDENPISSY